jgi:hypothetical protein
LPRYCYLGRVLVNYSPQVIFVKTRKTAGTSTEAVIQEALWGKQTGHKQGWVSTPSGFCTPRLRMKTQLGLFNALAIVLRLRLPLSAIGRVRKLRNHSGPESIRSTVGDRFWSRALKVVNTRNPFDMEVSAYFYLVNGMPEAKRPTFSEWIERKSSEPRDTWIRHIDDTWRIIRYESLDEDIASLLTQLDKPVPVAIPTYKSGIRPDEARNYRDMYTKETRAKVEGMYREYLERFDYAF